MSSQINYGKQNPSHIGQEFNIALFLNPWAGFQELCIKLNMRSTKSKEYILLIADIVCNSIFFSFHTQTCLSEIDY